MKKLVGILGMLVVAACSGEAFVSGTGGTAQGGHASGGTAQGAGGQGGTGGVAQAGNGQGGNGQAGSGQGGSILPCNPACGIGFTCCEGHCVNTANDILNCGTCGKICVGEHPFCTGDGCGTAPCDPGAVCNVTGSCCGADCCDPGQLCCVVQSGGPSGMPACYAPVNGSCPAGTPGGVCASPDTPIATPDGERPIASLRAGDLVLSVDGGVVRAVPLERVVRRRVVGHHVRRIRLDSGRIIEVSAPHPTADGRTLADLHAGDQLAGQGVVAVDDVPYAPDFTYDILPASDSGAYFAAGALIGSTLAAAPALVAPACFAPLR